MCGFYFNFNSLKITSMENNSTETKTRPSIEGRMRLFMQYPGQICHPIADAEFIPFPLNAMSLDWIWYEPGEFQLEPEKCCIALKPLGEISQEDLERVMSLQGFKITNEFSAKYIDWTDTGRKVRGFEWDNGYEWGRVIIHDLKYHVIDFLRSRGYALPYGPWSVDELVEFGIFKLVK